MNELDNDFKIIIHAVPTRCSTITYQLTPTVPSSITNVFWSVVSGNGVSIVSYNNNSVTVQATNNPQNGGPTVIQAKIYSTCNVPDYTVQATVPAPLDVDYRIIFQRINASGYYQAEIRPVISGDLDSWSDNGQLYSILTGNYTHIPSGTNGYIAGSTMPVWANVSTGCRASGTQSLNAVFSRQRPSQMDVQIYPNPTATNWNINMTPYTGSIIGQFRNAGGQLVWSRSTDIGSEDFKLVPGAELPPGNYSLILNFKGEVSEFTLTKQ